MIFSVGDAVRALAGPWLGEIGRVVAANLDDNTFHVTHQDGAFSAHYAVNQLEAAAAPSTPAAPQPKPYVAPLEPGMPHSRLARKQTPTYSGFRAYFPDAIAEVAKVSFISNEDHNPGEPLHWSREKSSDHLDAADRHLTDYAAGHVVDEQGRLALAQAVWRLLARIQLDVEAARATKGGK